MNRLQLRPFEREHLLLVEPWFTDADTQRWLGGPGWPRLTLDRAGRPLAEFRGAAETGRYRWLAWDRGTAVGYIDCGTYDRWTTWKGGPGGRGVIGVIDLPAGSISYVVDPALRRRGYCAAMVTAVLAMPELAGVEMFVAGVEPANEGSVGCLRKRGLRPLDPEPDWEGVVYYYRFSLTAGLSAHQVMINGHALSSPLSFVVVAAIPASPETRSGRRRSSGSVGRWLQWSRSVTERSATGAPDPPLWTTCPSSPPCPAGRISG